MLCMVMVLQTSSFSLPYESLFLDLVTVGITSVYYFLKIESANREEQQERVSFKYKQY